MIWSKLDYKNWVWSFLGFCFFVTVLLIIATLYVQVHDLRSKSSICKAGPLILSRASMNFITRYVNSNLYFVHLRDPSLLDLLSHELFYCVFHFFMHIVCIYCRMSWIPLVSASSCNGRYHSEFECEAWFMISVRCQQNYACQSIRSSDLVPLETWIFSLTRLEELIIYF